MSARSSEEEPLVEVGGEMPSSASDLRRFLFPNNKFARIGLLGVVVFVVAVFCWGVVWMESGTAVKGVVKKQKWTPADPIFPVAVLKDMDLDENPCKNFYTFSCHNYETAKLPEGEGNFQSLPLQVTIIRFFNKISFRRFFLSNSGTKLILLSSSAVVTFMGHSETQQSQSTEECFGS